MRRCRMSAGWNEGVCVRIICIFLLAGCASPVDERNREAAAAQQREQELADKAKALAEEDAKLAEYKIRMDEIMKSPSASRHVIPKEAIAWKDRLSSSDSLRLEPTIFVLLFYDGRYTSFAGARGMAIGSEGPVIPLADGTALIIQGEGQLFNLHIRTEPKARMIFIVNRSVGLVHVEGDGLVLDTAGRQLIRSP